MVQIIKKIVEKSPHKAFSKFALALRNQIRHILMCVCLLCQLHIYRGSHRLEKYLNIQDCLEKFLKIKFALISTGKTLKCLEKSLNSTIFCRT